MTDGPRSFTCPKHGVLVEIAPETEGCVDCVAFLDSAPDPAQMTGEQRAAELRGWFDIVLTVKFGRLHERIEALVGRSVWTHEMARPEPLIQEAGSWEHPGDLRRHVIDAACDIVGTEKVYVLATPTPSKGGGR